MKQLKKQKKQTPICKICFKDITSFHFHNIFNKDIFICESCIKKLNPIFLKFKIDDIDGLAIYEYKDLVKDLIFLYKGLEDYELKDVFLSQFKSEFKIKYHGYKIVPIPSYFENDFKRGYNHVGEIFKCLRLPILNCLIKTKNVKQKELTFKERQNISNFMDIKNDINLKNERILLVDDIVTTGSSMQAAIKLLKKSHVKDIKILCIAKNLLK